MKKKYQIVALSLIFMVFFLGCEKKPECFSEVVAFDKIVNKEILEKNFEKFVSNGAKIESSIEYSKYMGSLIKDKITTENVDKIVREHIKNSSEDYKIKYIIIENDKQDPHKKSQKCKLFAGYLLFEFYYKDTMFYKVQIDFMDTNGDDISKRVDCLFKMMKYQYKKL